MYILIQLYPTLCGPKYCNLLDSSVHGIFQARIVEWLSFPTPGDLPNPVIEPESLTSPALARGIFTTLTIWEAPYSDYKWIKSKPVTERYAEIPKYLETKEHRKNIQGLCDNSQRNNIDKMVISEREYQKKSKFFPKLMLDTKPQIQEALRILSRINVGEKNAPRHINVRWKKIKEK